MSGSNTPPVGSELNPLGVAKVHGHAVDGSSVGSKPSYITISTAINILEYNPANPVTGSSPASQAALDKLIEIVSTRGQPIILGIPTLASGVYTVRFMNEHYGAWEGTGAGTTGVPANAYTFGGTNSQSLAATITSAGVNYGFGGANDPSLTVTFSASL